MSYNLDKIACPTLQGQLDDAFPDAVAIEDLPVLQFLFSPLNTNNVLQRIISPGGGKLKSVQLLYTPRMPEELVSDTVAFTCDNEDTEGHLSETYELDPTDGVFKGESFSIAELSVICEDNGSYFVGRIQAIMDALLRKMETKLVDKLAGLTGKFAKNDTEGVNVGRTLKTVATLGSDGKVSHEFWREIAFSAKKAAFGKTPFVWGDGLMTKAVWDIFAGCCASYGVNLNDFANDHPFIYGDSDRIEDAFGDDHFVVVNPGSVQPVWYNQFMGRNGINQFESETYQQTVLTDPRYGIPFDYVYKVDCGRVIIELGVAFDLLGLPDDLYDSLDRLEGVNGVLEFAISNP